MRFEVKETKKYGRNKPAATTLRVFFSFPQEYREINRKLTNFLHNLSKYFSNFLIYT